MSKWCRYVKTLLVYFVKMMQVQKKKSVQEVPDHIIIYSYFKCNRTNECSGQSKQSEFTRLASILIYVTKLDIVMVAISYFAINHSLRSTFGEELSMNLSRLLGSKRMN